MIEYKTTNKALVDIHNMTHDEAQRYIISFLNKINGNVKEVEIIHGYSGGTVLQNMVRKRLKHPKIKSKMVSLNPGITILIL